MDTLIFWKLHDEVQLEQAALLILDIDPSDFPNVLELPNEKRPGNFETAYSALLTAVRTGKLPGERAQPIPNRTVLDPSAPRRPSATVWEPVLIKLSDLRDWVAARGIECRFFSKIETMADTPDCLDKSHPCYSKKLAAALEAWKAVSSDPQKSKGVKKTAKRHLTDWLEKNAERFGLIKDDGSLNSLGIEECVKVANFSYGGPPRSN